MTETVAARLGFRGTKQVAQFFGLSESTVRQLATRGEWPTYCIGGRRLFDLDELVRLVKKGGDDGK
jgi:excisionase family DNA binding protein